MCGEQARRTTAWAASCKTCGPQRSRQRSRHRVLCESPDNLLPFNHVHALLRNGVGRSVSGTNVPRGGGSLAAAHDEIGERSRDPADPTAWVGASMGCGAGGGRMRRACATRGPKCTLRGHAGLLSCSVLTRSESADQQQQLVKLRRTRALGHSSDTVIVDAGGARSGAELHSLHAPQGQGPPEAASGAWGSVWVLPFQVVRGPRTWHMPHAHTPSPSNFVEGPGYL